ncbi:hypothetical protein SY2F82_69670 [Streptomyces sp. Y2F8-2]|nr:hypothetical protein SY2F82_69670 [Streptomyces sp. Y2F8-2]
MPAADAPGAGTAAVTAAAPAAVPAIFSMLRRLIRALTWVRPRSRQMVDADDCAQETAPDPADNKKWRGLDGPEHTGGSNRCGQQP